LPLTGGGIWLDDVRIDRLKPEARGFGMVFQNYALFPHMSVRRNVGFGLMMQRRGRAEIADKVDAALALVRLGDQSAKLPGQLSGGQQQRVAIARAIVIEPPLVLMDEPLSNLDAKLRVGMRASLAELHERLHVTTVYVTHDQVEAMTLGQRVCVLRDGMLQQVDTPQNLYDHPVNLFVGGFIGSPSMNLVTAKMTSDDDGAAVTFAGHRLAIPESVVHANPEIKTYFGRDVILGIRPSDFEDASLTEPSWPRMPVAAHVIEALGSEIHVIFFIDAPPVDHKDIADLGPEEEEDESGIPLHEGKSLWTARVNARSSVRAGDRIELGVDTSNMHFFDPDSGLAIGRKKITDSRSVTSKQQSPDAEDTASPKLAS
jgi:multiple sugar transport system ATP-binding protein